MFAKKKCQELGPECMAFEIFWDNESKKGTCRFRSGGILTVQDEIFESDSRDCYEVVPGFTEDGTCVYEDPEYCPIYTIYSGYSCPGGGTDLLREYPFEDVQDCKDKCTSYGEACSGFR